MLKLTTATLGFPCRLRRDGRHCAVQPSNAVLRDRARRCSRGGQLSRSRLPGQRFFETTPSLPCREGSAPRIIHSLSSTSRLRALTARRTLLLVQPSHETHRKADVDTKISAIPGSRPAKQAPVLLEHGVCPLLRSRVTCSNSPCLRVCSILAPICPVHVYVSLATSG